MQLVRVGLIVALLVSQFAAMPVVSAATTGVVISQVQAGNSSSSRLIEVYNNSDQPVDITGWCARYVTASSSSARACFNGSAAGQHLLLAERSYLLIGSSQLTGVRADYAMAEGLGTGTSGAVQLVNGQ